MKTSNPNDDHNARLGARTGWFLISVIILLGIVAGVQGFVLFKMKPEHGGVALGQIWRAQIEKIKPFQIGKDHPPAAGPRDDQVILWEADDDLAQIHDQITRLLMNMTPGFSASMQHDPEDHLPAMARTSRDISRLQDDIERIFNQAYNECRQRSLLARLTRGWDVVPSLAAMNIADQGSNYVVTVSLPGHDKQGIAIRLEGRLLIITANQPLRAHAAADRNAAVARRDWFHTQIMVPENSEGDRAQAVYNDNVLSVFIPKTQGSNSLVRLIPIR